MDFACAVFLVVPGDARPVLLSSVTLMHHMHGMVLLGLAGEWGGRYASGIAPAVKDGISADYYDGQ